MTEIQRGEPVRYISDGPIQTMTTTTTHRVFITENGTAELNPGGTEHVRAQIQRFGSDSVASDVRREDQRAVGPGRRLASESATAQVMWPKAEHATAEMKGDGVETVTEVKLQEIKPHIPPEKLNAKVTYIDGKCTCCPYGYHIDLDFLRFGDSMSSGKYLQQLKKIQREKRKLRKSMEVYLQKQEQGTSSAPPPDVVNIHSQNVYNYFDYQDSRTNKLLDEIDSSVDATLSSIDYMLNTSKSSNFSSGSERTPSPVSPRSAQKFNTFPRIRDQHEERTKVQQLFSTSGRTDSNSSLSSVSTLASEKQGYTHTTNITNEMNITHTTNMTSEQLAATMATHLPLTDDGMSPQGTTNISKNSLQAVREAMAVSLQRMRELEEQVKALPVLQVRISVLKEEKRLLMLQLKAKNSNLNTRSVGVGDDTVQLRSPLPIKSPPPTFPKPKVKITGHGEHSVLIPYLLQPDLPSSYTIRDNEDVVRSDSELREKETIVIEKLRNQSILFSPVPPSPKPMTRSIGVGDGNVFDDSGMSIHEKELRTVIIGQKASVGKRNVGVDCRVPTRDVGVSYSFDREKPTTRTVGVSVDTESFFKTLSVKSEEIRMALQDVLHKNVRSVGTTCDLRPLQVHAGVQYSAMHMSSRSIGVGDTNIDVEVRTPVPKRSVGVDAQPSIANRSVNTDYGWRLDASTNTARIRTESKQVSTEKARQTNISMMTDRDVVVSEGSQTDVKVFMFTDQLKNAGSNTQRMYSQNVGVNTDVKELSSENFNCEISFTQKGTSTSFAERDRLAATRESKDIGVSEDRIDSFVCSFGENDVQKQVETYSSVNEQKMQPSVSSGSNFVIETSREYSSPVSVSEVVSETHREYSSPQLQKIMTRGSSTDETVERNIEEKITQVSADGQHWKEINRGQEVVEKKITSHREGDGSYRITTVTTKKSLGESGAENVETVEETKIVSDEADLKMALQSMEVTETEQTESKKEKAGRLRAELNLLGAVMKPSTSGRSYSDQDISTSSSRGQSEMITRRVMLTDSGQTVSEERIMSSSGPDGQNGLTFENRHFDLLGENGSLKSCMKKSKSDTQVKKGISFAETVTGGYTSSSSSEEDDSSDVVETDTESTSSYEEGCYDSQEGSISYTCKDDEAIAQGAPGAVMFDQNIRETFELNSEMQGACNTLSDYLEDSTTVQTKQLNASLNVISQEWFKISSHKLSNQHQVEDYLSSFNEISSRLLEYIVNMQDSNGNTSVHYAVSQCNFDVVNLLLDTGILDLNKQNTAGYTAIMLATLASLQTDRDFEVVQRLFSMGDVNTRAVKDGQTALMLAVSQGRADMVKMLLDCGANVNAQDEEGSTALMCACEHGHTEIVKLLLAHPDCDAALTDHDGSTALSIAMDADHKDIGVLLYAHVNFTRPQASPGLNKKKRSSSSSSTSSTSIR